MCNGLLQPATVNIVNKMMQKKTFLHSLLLLGGLLISGVSLAAPDFSQQLNGKRLTYQSAKCAGILFARNGKTAYIFSEVGCKPDVELRVKWLSEDTVLLVETSRLEKNRAAEAIAPRTFIYKVRSLKKSAVLTQIWTGWGEYKDQDYYFNVE